MINQEKYKNAILYLATNLEKGRVEGRKKLYKLLYYIDFDAYEKLGTSITGESYRKISMGPAPKNLTSVAKRLIQEGLLEVSKKPTGKNLKDTFIYEARQKPNLDVFDKNELYILNRVIKMYGSKTGKQLEDMTHKEAPYLAVTAGEDMPLELAYYRGTDFSN